MAAVSTCWACGGPAGPTPTAPHPSLHECPACGHLFAPDTDAAALAALYDADYFEGYAGEGYEAVEAQRRHEARVRLAWMRRHGAGGGRLYEVGAAAGYFLAEARAAGWDVSGVEPSDAQARLAREHLGLPVATGMLEEQALEDGGFDAVCAFHVLEHIVDPLPQLERLRRALRPGGRLVVEVPNGRSVRARRLGAGWPILGLPYHVSQFGPRSLRAVLERAGFAAGDVHTDTIPFTAYEPREVARRPRHVAHRALQAVQLRTAAPTHPDRHELLRAVAVAQRGAPAA